MTTAAIDAWLEAPLRRFVRDSRVRFALLLEPNGQVLAQHGFTRAVDVMAACALAAAIHASADRLGEEVNGIPFRELYHAGAKRQMYLASLAIPSRSIVVLTVFDSDTSLGLVQLYMRALGDAVRTAAPALPPAARPALDANFEGELNRNLAILFGRAPAASVAPEASHPIA
ncbi:MAG TPA: roadblock/LC7 domain-containing protein [Gemmatimonadaceae bacterium]|nr:roadblock/LC7 domain-containing protein [Gemmatimonadaceae bacterium]